jgi:hypothetical protein
MLYYFKERVDHFKNIFYNKLVVHKISVEKSSDLKYLALNNTYNSQPYFEEKFFSTVIF